MARFTNEFHYSEEYPIAPLEDDCKLLSSLLDDCLRNEIGSEQFRNVELLRELASSASTLAQKDDSESAQFLLEKLFQQIRSMPLKQTLPVARACGHYLNLTGVAEMHHRVRQSHAAGLGAQSFDDVFMHLLSKGVSPEVLFETVRGHSLELVLTAHPTQIVRRSLQYKLAKIAALLDQKDKNAKMGGGVERVLGDLVREVTGLWQTQEFRSWTPTAIDEARGGLNIVEQSLWDAVPSYLRTLNAALKKATGRDLPIDARVVSFGSWMGGDREADSAVTANVVRQVAFLARWIAVDLYLRDIDALRFELSMNRCSDSLWKLVKEIAEKNGLDIQDTGWEGDYGLSNFSSEDAHHAVLLPGAFEASSTAMSAPRETPTMPLLERRSADAKKNIVSPTAPQAILSSHEITQNGTSKKLPVEANGTKSPSDGSFSPLSASTPKKQTSKKSLAASGSQNRLDELLDPIQPSRHHEGSHPYRLLLGDVRQKLVNTRRKMESLLVDELVATEDYYESVEDLQKTLVAVYESLKDSGAGVIADGRLLDVIRRVNCFGLSLIKLDIRQDATKHVDAMNEVTSYLGLGAYKQWTEDQRMEFLTKELSGNRPLVAIDMHMSKETKEFIDILIAAAELGPSYLGAYVVGSPSAASDVLLALFFQREALFMKALQTGTYPNFHHFMRIVPMFNTLHGLETAAAMLDAIFTNQHYREHIRSRHGNCQEVMLGYCDSGKDSCRLSAIWALHKCQEQVVALCKERGVHLTMLYGRGGCMGRGGGAPLASAIQSQPPGAISGSLRMIEQGEMVLAKFGVSAVAEEQLETCASALLASTLMPKSAVKNQKWLELMEHLSETACAAYHAVIDHPHFESYSRHVTPELERAAITLADRHGDNDNDPHAIKSIPWIFGWTQTRHVFPSWLGFGDAVQKAIEDGHLGLLQEMYAKWPLFHSTVDLIEMVLAKVDTRIASVYDDALVKDAEEKVIGKMIRDGYIVAVRATLQVTGHKRLCDHNPLLKHLISLRCPCLDAINVLQVQILKELRSKHSNSKQLRDALMVTINGIAAGMRNTA